MIKLYNENGHFARTELENVNNAHRKWLKLKEKADGLRDRRLKLEEEERNKKSKIPNNNRTFVNSFGEATKRNITTTTYEKRQKRIERAVLRNMGY